MYRFIEREIVGIIIFTLQSMHQIRKKYERNKHVKFHIMNVNRYWAGIVLFGDLCRETAWTVIYIQIEMIKEVKKCINTKKNCLKLAKSNYDLPV